MANIILASHGELAKGMLHSASMIIGDLTKGVEVFCLYPGQNPQDYADQLRLKIENSRDAWIILADILGGSVHTALSQLTAFGDVTVLSGMNLNLVLSVLLAIMMMSVRSVWHILWMRLKQESPVERA